jgi:alpha-1,4-digalacturonate transport system permease protein
MRSWQRGGWTPYVFLAPNLIIFLLFTLIPAGANFYLSVWSTSPYREPAYVGLGNFGYLIGTDDLFVRAMRNVAVYVLGDLTAMLPLSLGAALLLNQRIRFRGFFRAAFFYPVLLSPVVVALVWKWVLGLDYGVLNATIETLGFSRQPWLLRPDLAMFSVILVGVWANLGFYALIILAGLQGIPPVLYEAATMDGAGRWERFRHVVLPLLLPTLFVVLVLNLIRGFQVFDHVFVLTNGGPGFATMMMVQYVYRTGFEQNQLGLASSAALVLFVVVLSLTALQYLLGRMREAV